MIVVLRVWIGCDTLYFNFPLLNISDLCILSALRWLHSWPNYVEGHCLYKLISIYFCAFVGNINIYFNVILLPFIIMDCSIRSIVKTGINVIKEVPLSYGTNSLCINKGFSCMSVLNTVVIQTV
jgi:hypothetical protein